MLALLLALGMVAAPDPSHDALAQLWTWDVECQEKGCLMFLDIAHGEGAEPEFLTITVAVNRKSKDVAFISFIVPNGADLDKGLAIGFTNSNQRADGQWDMQLAEGSTRVLKFEGCREDFCTARAVGGIVPATVDAAASDLLAAFLNNRNVLFFYWVGGERRKAAATLANFHSQYATVLQERLE